MEKIDFKKLNFADIKKNTNILIVGNDKTNKILICKKIISYLPFQ